MVIYIPVARISLPRAIRNHKLPVTAVLQLPGGHLRGSIHPLSDGGAVGVGVGTSNGLLNAAFEVQVAPAG